MTRSQNLEGELVGSLAIHIGFVSFLTGLNRSGYELGSLSDSNSCHIVRCAGHFEGQCARFPLVVRDSIHDWNLQSVWKSHEVGELESASRMTAGWHMLARFGGYLCALAREVHGEESLVGVPLLAKPYR